MESKLITLQNEQFILRKYDLNNDPPLMVQFLFDKMNSEKGIKELREGDQILLVKSPNKSIRLVAEIHGELIVTLTLSAEFWILEGLHIYSMVTAEQYRGTGISTRLFQYGCNYARDQNKRLLTVDTKGTNFAAQKFFKKMGFIEFGKIPNALILSGNTKEDLVFYYYFLPDISPNI